MIPWMFVFKSSARPRYFFEQQEQMGDHLPPERKIVDSASLASERDEMFNRLRKQTVHNKTLHLDVRPNIILKDMGDDGNNDENISQQTEKGQDNAEPKQVRFQEIPYGMSEYHPSESHNRSNNITSCMVSRITSFVVGFLLGIICMMLMNHKVITNVT